MKKGTSHIIAFLLLAFVLAATPAFGQSGKWTKKANSISGTWSITEQKGKKVLVLKGFKTATAPDLKIFLSPKAGSSISSRTATQGAVMVAKLRSSKGDQTYTIPAGVDLSKYKTVLIHCEKYSKLWGTGKL